MTRRRLVVVGALALAAAGYASWNRAARREILRQGWFDTWEYLTRKDLKLSFRLREGVTSTYSGVPVFVNDDGMRAREARGHVPPKRPGELLVLSAGDSTTFGVFVPYDETYSAGLERRLAGLVGVPVRVVNVAVPGHSLFQTAALVREWTAILHPDVIVVADSYNSRAFTGRKDAAAGFLVDYLLTRPYEVGPYISYPVLGAYRKYVVLPHLSRGEAPPRLADPAPAPRVPFDAWSDLVRGLVAFAAQERCGLVFLMTGEMAGPMMAAGVSAFRLGRWQEALDLFEQVRAFQPTWFLPAYYAYRCAVQLHRPEAAALIETQLGAASAGLPSRYLGNFATLSADGVPPLQEAARRDGVAFVEVSREMQGRFIDVSHYDPTGHALVAERLAPVVARLGGKGGDRLSSGAAGR